MPDTATPPLDLPALPLADWQDSKETLHLFLQIVGKIRMTLHPKLNHWWHVTLYPVPRGFTTGRIPYGGREIEILFDVIDHELRIMDSTGAVESFAVSGLSVADFYEQTLAALGRLGVAVQILAKPYDHKSKTPFAEDRAHAGYDGESVRRFQRIVSEVASVFEVFRGRFVGKSTPVHLYWHSFDLALTRFSGRAAPPMEGGTRADKEAYSHEVISFGFWAGDDQTPAPAFYSYTYPEPKGLRDAALSPAEAIWADRNGSALAVYGYDDFRQAPDPRAALLSFMESAYQAGAARAGWPVAELTHAHAEA